MEAQSFFKMPDATMDDDDDDDEETIDETTSKVPKVKFNIEEDRRFLAKSMFKIVLDSFLKIIIF